MIENMKHPNLLYLTATLLSLVAAGQFSVALQQGFAQNINSSALSSNQTNQTTFSVGEVEITIKAIPALKFDGRQFIKGTIHCFQDAEGNVVSDENGPICFQSFI
jgi:hypothetical protein